MRALHSFPFHSICTIVRRLRIEIVLYMTIHTEDQLYFDRDLFLCYLFYGYY